MEPDRRRTLRPLVRPAGLAPVLDALHDKLSSRCGPTGTIVVETPAAADALEDLIGKRVPPGKPIRLSEVDRLLRERTPFLSLQEAVEVYRDAPVVFPRVEKAKARQGRERAVARCFALLLELGLSPLARSHVVHWMEASREGLLRDAGRWGEAALLEAIRAVAVAFDRLPEPGAPPLYLDALANEVTGDAHGFDAGRPAGALLFRALAFRFPESAAGEERGSTAWKSRLLTAAGLARDPVSVFVFAFGLYGESEYLKVLRQRGLDRPLTLLSLAELASDIRAWKDVAFVVENPIVFAALVQHVTRVFLPENHPTLVCTNGNLNAADHRLLGLLRAAGAHLFYSGDFDAKGLEIATVVLERYSPGASPWRMTPADYRRALRGDHATLDSAALQRAGRFFPELVAAMGERRQAVHHEGLIDDLTRDLNRFVTDGETPPRRGEPPRAAPHQVATP